MGSFRLCLITLFLGIVAGNPVQHLNLTKFDLVQNLQIDDIKNILKADKAGQIAIVNDYVDKLLPNLNQFLSEQGVDPIPLPDVGGEFGIGFIKGELSLRKGEIYGVASFLRNGDVELWYEFPNVKIKAPLKFNKLGFNYDYVIQFMGLGPEGKAVGEIKGCRWILHLQLDMTTLKAKLEKYDLQSLGDVSLKFEGGILEWMLNVVISVAIGFVKPVLALVVEIIVKGGLEAVIDAYNKIIDGILQGGAF